MKNGVDKKIFFFHSSSIEDTSFDNKSKWEIEGTKTALIYITEDHIVIHGRSQSWNFQCR